MGLGEDDLFIMYYTGHGVNYVGKAQWESADYQDRGQQEVSGIVFSDMIEAVINPLPCAVVMLLDCCNASLAAIGADKWILAASGVLEKSSKTNIDNPQAVLQRTFTEDLIEQFTLAADDKIALSLLQLHRRIVYKQAARQSNVDTAVLTAPHTDFERSIRFTGLKWPVTFLNTIPLDIDPKKVCAIKLTATMTDGDQSTLEKFKQWATTNAPAGTRIRVDGIQFEEVKKSFSAVLIFNMHVALWDCLQDHPDITTVALTPLWSARSDTLRNVTNMPLRPLGGGTTGGGENQRPEHRRGGSSGKPSGSGGGGSR